MQKSFTLQQLSKKVEAAYQTFNLLKPTSQIRLYISYIYGPRD